jgi:5-methyltetrahydrofolate--homocysteine methyltransferase
MKVPGDRIIVIGENFNSTRKIKASSPRAVHKDGTVGIAYVDLDGTKRMLDVTKVMPADPAKREKFMIPHIAEACRQKDLTYITWAIKAQELAGAHIIDLCADEISVEPEERHQWMRWLVRTAQGITNSILSIDSSDSNTIRAGLEVHDGSKSRPAVNSINLEPGRSDLIGIAREHNALLFANASGSDGMPQDADERVSNMTKCMDLMDKGGIPMEDRFLDPLVFPIGAGPQFGANYLDAIAILRKRYPKVHIFGGHSNVSFGLPDRKLLNQTFVQLAILAGCDAVMIDPLMNPPREFDAFRFSAEALLGRDEYSTRYLKYNRSLPR